VIKKLIIIIIFLLSSTALYAADPVLFFSDLTSAPKTGWEESATKGAAVSIYGLNFGAAGSVVGTVNVTTDNETTQIGDSDATYMVEWAATSGNPKLDAATTLQRITFHLNSSMSTDATSTISVTVDGNTSGTIAFGVRNTGKIYFISKDDGNDSNDGLRDTDEGSNVGPWLTPKMCMPSNNGDITEGDGDVVYLRVGATAYTNSDDGDGRFVQMSGDLGTAVAPLTLIGYPGELPVIDRDSAGRIGQIEATEHGYVTFAKLKFINSSTAITAKGHGYRIVNLYFQDMDDNAAAGIIHHQPAANYFILGCVWKDCGSDSWHHAIYLTTEGAVAYIADNYNGVVAYCEFDNYESPGSGEHGSGGGIIDIKEQESGTTTYNIRVHHNYFHDCNEAAPFYVNSDTYDVNIYNNLVTNCYTVALDSGTGIIHANHVGDIYLYNNTFVNSGYTSFFRIKNDTDLHSSNNIFYDDGGTPYLLQDGGSPTFTSNNDNFYSDGESVPSGSGITVNNEITTDPTFTDSVASNYTIQSGSDCIDGGTSDVSGTVTDDLVGISRPQDSVYDIGAYEGAGAAVGGSTITGISFPSGGVSCCQ